MIAIEDDPHALVDLERELVDRYGSHYQVECFGSAPDLRARLRQLAEDDADVALVLAAHRLAGTTGSELLDETRRLVCRIMEDTDLLSVPLKVEVETGRNWEEMR